MFVSRETLVKKITESAGSIITVDFIKKDWGKENPQRSYWCQDTRQGYWPTNDELSAPDRNLRSSVGQGQS
jgi:hypothetical protein